MVYPEGLEPSPLTRPAPQAGASAVPPRVHGVLAALLVGHFAVQRTSGPFCIRNSASPNLLGRRFTSSLVASGGPGGIRTHNLLLARESLFRWSYRPRAPISSLTAFRWVHGQLISEGDSENWGGAGNRTPCFGSHPLPQTHCYPNAARPGIEPGAFGLTGRCTAGCAIWQRLGTRDSNPHDKDQNLACCRYTNPE